jgi:hypothetical protein
VNEIYSFIEGEKEISQEQVAAWGRSSDPESVELAMHAIACCNSRISPPVEEGAFFAILLHAICIPAHRTMPDTFAYWNQCFAS